MKSNSRSLIARQAASAACALRSVPAEAAVGAGIGHLGGRGRGDLDLVEPDAELLGDHLGDLDEEPLPHLGAAVVQAIEPSR